MDIEDASIRQEMERLAWHGRIHHKVAMWIKELTGHIIIAVIQIVKREFGAIQQKHFKDFVIQSAK